MDAMNPERNLSRIFDGCLGSWCGMFTFRVVGETWKLDEKSQLTVLLASFLQTLHLVCVAYTVLPLPVSIIGLE